MNNFENLFLHFLKDIYYAENKILKTLPELKTAAHSPELKNAIARHFTETQGQVKRLDQVFAIFDQKPEAVTCTAIDGIMEEGEELMADNPKAGPVRDAGIIANCQAVEHYEMARYSALIAWADEMGKDDVVFLLKQTLLEERSTDEALTDLAANEVNPDALDSVAA